MSTDADRMAEPSEGLVKRLWRRLGLTPRQLALYWAFNTALDSVNHQVGQWLELARFTYFWQAGTAGLVAALGAAWVRRRSFVDQYCFGLMVMGFVEFLGYGLETSYAYPGNLFERAFGVRNLSLTMTLLFGLLFPITNAVVPALERALFKNARAEPEDGGGR